MRRILSACMVSSLMLCSCGDKANPLLPRSGGRPYEVLVVTADKASASIMDSILTQNTPGLPQAEPMFDVSVADSADFNQTTRTARSIVVVTKDPLRFTSTRIRYEKNVWARPQIIIYVNTPSAEALRRDMDRQGKMLTDLLTRAEMNAVISVLNRKNNLKAGKYINNVFGADMKIPADMKSEKRGQDFLWLSDNSANGMRNICVYSYKGKDLDVSDFLAARDSVMKINIPGERSGMYMQTAKENVTAVFRKERGRTMMVCRGLWEMHGDAMGGPFVSVSTVDTVRNRIIVAEAFVYAPEMKKRNLIRQTEAAISTMKINSSNKITIGNQTKGQNTSVLQRKNGDAAHSQTIKHT